MTTTMTISTRIFGRALFAAALVCTPTLAFAHHAEFMGNKPFAQGMSMPLHGVDHMLVIVAVGLIAAQIGGRALWAIPSAFVGAILLGGLLNLSGVAMPLLEFGILASVIVCGGILAWGTSLSLAVTIGIVSLLALFHGEALIANDGLVHDLPWFILGCVLSAVFLLGTGIGAGALLRRADRASAPRYVGFALMAAAVVIGFFPAVNDFAVRLLEN